MPFNDFNCQPFVGNSKNPDQLEKVELNCIITANIGLSWRGVDCQFDDWLYLARINLGKDQLPPALYQQLLGTKRGAIIEQDYPAGELVASWQAEQQFELNRDQLSTADSGRSAPGARLGRFYPAHYFEPALQNRLAANLPCRITSLSDDLMTLDCNHPLSRYDLRLRLQIEDIYRTGSDEDEPCRDIMAGVCDQGPGMQDRLPQQETDFFSDRPFARLDENDDADFFRRPSLSPFWDQQALFEVSSLYRQLIPPRADILDLMAGVHSPLQDSNLNVASLSCAGLNGEELAHNPLCDTCRVLDVNQIQALPYPDRQFDVVLIHAAIEYVTQPYLLLREISRVLRSGGRIIISFSNRSLAEKAIRAWAGAYEFERPAILLSYLRSTGSFDHFHCHSQRGRSRPADDRLAPGLDYSDPVYLLWADKTID
ncbi:MAG: methyltransferase domain-containing protein [Gammaproteobacteria bacterium]|nr:methyltransferase domain-containing protein [Gammaproteobacteria bacterium]